MTGLDKILDAIRQEADEAAKQRLAEAEQEIEALKQKAAEEEREQKAKAEEKCSAEVKTALERGASAAGLEKRKLLLNAKQEIIADMLEEAKKTLLALPDDKYFETITKMVAKYNLKQKGEILFSKKDKQRVPASFLEAMKAQSLTVSEETREISGGFVLLYGDIEENCSFDALFFEAKEELQDKVRDLLFA